MTANSILVPNLAVIELTARLGHWAQVLTSGNEGPRMCLAQMSMGQVQVHDSDDHPSAEQSFLTATGESKRLEKSAPMFISSLQCLDC